MNSCFHQATIESKDKDTNRHEAPEMVPRQFIDLGLPSAEVSSDERITSRSPQSLLEDSSSRQRAKRVLEIEESPENESNGWGNPSKVSKHNASSSNGNGNAIDQSAAEATMRKARVSVRARSEAPMVTKGLVSLAFKD